MGMKLAPHVLGGDQNGKAAVGCPLDLVVSLAEFGLDKREAELSVKIRFGREGGFSRFQAARNGGKLAKVRL
jgi:hypothetical protein